MTITTQPTTVEYIGVENGLTFKITVFQEPGGEFHAQIEVLEGSADFNALYFGDDVLDGSSFSFGKSLGMNGAGQTDQYGNLVDWDSGVKLSDPGLGKLGLNKDTYLTAGETMIVSLPGVDSWDDVAEIGVRATSTSTPSGSIKTVLEPVDVVEEPEEPSVVEAPPAVVDVIEGPTDVTGPATETTTTQPVQRKSTLLPQLTKHPAAPRQPKPRHLKPSARCRSKKPSATCRSKKPAVICLLK
jgi:hypothetical protein